jgi:fumarate hydratase, class I
LTLKDYELSFALRIFDKKVGGVMQVDKKLSDSIIELIRRVSSTLPKDVWEAMEEARKNEIIGSRAQNVLGQLLENAELASKEDLPICQDTGTLVFYVHFPVAIKQLDIQRAIINAVRVATKRNYLRHNAVNSIDGKNSGDNTGIGFPFIHFDQWGKDYLEVKLLLKGGGSENCSAQYRLPDSELGAGRDLEGVRKCVIDAVLKAQGQGCAPGIIGVGIGGDRAGSHLLAKEQLFRKLNDVNEDRHLADLEKKLFSELNSLNIGPMGFGGKTTVLGVKMGHRHRVPASFFVSIAYLCWAARRGGMIIKKGKVKYD